MLVVYSSKLKLLFAIDMLNEGVHVDNVSGVILFRPTISPIIFKQQIGRALCTGKDRSAVILDLVDNISNLYSIGAIEEEMQAAITYYHYLGQSEKIVNESFEVIDEVHDCKRLFDELEETLSLSWELMFQEAVKYRSENGDLQIQRRYVTDDGLPLGQWVHTQRRAYWGTVLGRLSKEQIEKLNSIDMIWERYSEISWERYYKIAQTYYKTNGNLKIPYDYETEDGLPLGEWIARQRQYRSSRRNSALTEERISRLDAIGMRWDALNYQWEENYQEAVNYYRTHGDLMIPVSFVSTNGIRLGLWISRLRSIRSDNSTGNELSEEQISRLNRIGMVWNTEEASWMAAYERAAGYYEINGNLRITRDYKSPDGYSLGQWIGKQRLRKISGELAEDRIVLLVKIGICWTISRDNWDKYYSAAKDYYKEKGHLNVLHDYVSPDGLNLGTWLSTQRNSKDRLSAERVSALEAIEMKWENKYIVSWQNKFNAVKRYYEEHGNIQIPYDYISTEGYNLNLWLVAVRKQYRNNKLNTEQIRAMEELGMLWEVFDDKWMQHYSEAEQYYRKHGHLNTIRSENPRLDSWLCTQRKSKDTLSLKRRQLLDNIHMCWEDALEVRWLASYKIAKAYYLKHNNLLIPATYITEDGKKLGSWISEQRKNRRKGKLSDEHYQKLNEIGMVWELKGCVRKESR